MALPSLFFRIRPLALALSLGGLGGCMLGPDYQRPALSMPVEYKEAAGWKAATPRDGEAHGEWWRAFGDTQLDALLAQVEVSNQNVAQYLAQYAQALALTGQARAGLFPTLRGSAGMTRSGSGGGTYLTSGTGSSTSSGSGTSGSSGDGAQSTSRSVSGISDTYSAQLSLSWELDLWGKLRRTLEENRASAEASAAELANATLSAQSSLAQNYFQLRVLDERIKLYDINIRSYERYRQVVRDQYEEGQTSRATLAQAETQLESARASSLELQWQRAQYEHAIAILIGKAPAEFSLPVAERFDYRIPEASAGVASRLLERRPDVAAAEREVAAANAAIGVAQSGYFPDLTLSASGGFQSSGTKNLFTVANRFWSIGPSFSQTLFDFGATRAEVDQARAAYDAAVASYRQTVLDALGEVEDYLVELRTLETELAARRRAADAARESERVTYDQYQEGMIDYLDVATTQSTSLSEQQSALQLVATQLVTSVQLIVALGGDWQGGAEELAEAR
ncbi:efflux transporter outer membrane subunit [Azotobacter beijerinckii]|uniref:Efflux transporter, outer membrane factor (OMF) lipoprotein, NodT family n=1 Tax=Azotobacter beijerinckii TaxID=170623 RepID=A0A1I4C995_9GAMM|nr:efflux transporter outer membrane subunit [Azotobacter beijerinckii]SFB16131.1 efflux transporter, outer membrane factor (OMF) lipoprotein, NodT family [Azotobacter beijerinckii]SFK76746.1 efflux transporter, outer membrane factor (OMF) lipoprotein, NodT family [Azotobacter beijerinckii]